MMTPPDFKSWSNENLARLCEDLWVENCVIRENLKVMHAEWRELVKQRLETVKVSDER
jgi:hypothetical protein